MFVTVVKLHVDPAKRDLAWAAAAAAEAGTRHEPGALYYKFSLDPDDPGILYVVEFWRSEEDLVDHIEKPYLKSFMIAMKDAGLHAFEGKKYHVSSVEEIAMPLEWA